MIEQTAREDLEPQVMKVKVINRNEWTISDMFDGVPYDFPSNVAISIPIDAAYHIFGWHPEVDRKAMRAYCQKRFGWNTPAMQQGSKGDLFFDRLTIEPIYYRMIEVPAEQAQETAPQQEIIPPRAPRLNKMMAAAEEAAGRHV